MASPALTTRRSLFAIAGAATLLPAAAMAAQSEPASEWDRLASALAVINPKFEQLAHDARAAGYEPDELHMVFQANDGGTPFLLFRREFGDNPGPRTFPRDGLTSGVR